MKQWMAVGVIAVIATGLSLANDAPRVEAASTPGLPNGWTSEGLAAGLDEVNVHRPKGGGTADLVITKRHDAPPDNPLIVYQTFDAVPWRGRTIVFSSMVRVHMEPDVMRRAGSTTVAELRIECDGQQPGSMASVIDRSHTRSWLENNLPLKVANDATRCSFGVASMIEAEIRLSKLRLKDRGKEYELFLAKRWPEMESKSKLGSMFTAGAVASASVIAPPNLEFKQ